MIWPPLKAWTSNFPIEGKLHFVAINYGGEKSNRWVVLMSVIDSLVVVKVPWLKLIDPFFWKCGWDETNYSSSSDKANNNEEIIPIECSKLSIDSGLTIPITNSIIRPWFRDV